MSEKNGIIGKFAALLGILAILGGSIWAYANVAYFPMDRGIKVEAKVASMDTMNGKLDNILDLLNKNQKKRS